MHPSSDEVSIADQWWEQLEESRRVQICRWVTQKKTFSGLEMPGQLDLLEVKGGDEHGSYDHAI